MIADKLTHRKAALQLVSDLGIQPLLTSDWAYALQLLKAKPRPGYADTWTYITQAANGRALGTHETGYIARAPNAMCSVGIFQRPVTGELAVHLINPLGFEATALVRRLCEKIREVGNCVIYVKKADHEIVSELQAGGGFTWCDDNAWHAQAPAEDDTWPELLIEVSRSLSLFEAGRLNQARDKYARFVNRALNKDVRWLDLTPGHYPDARRVVELFFKYKEEEHVDISHPCDYENMLLRPSPVKQPGALIRQLCTIDDQPAALIIMEHISGSEAVGLYCNLSLYQEHKYLSEFVIHHALGMAHQHGFRYMNLGGSESLGLHQFKSKFQPIEQMERQWLVYT